MLEGMVVEIAFALDALLSHWTNPALIVAIIPVQMMSPFSSKRIAGPGGTGIPGRRRYRACSTVGLEMTPRISAFRPVGCYCGRCFCI